MTAAKLRAWWWQRQGLGGDLDPRSPSEILERAGWARSVGGVNPYLTLFARGGTRRAVVDAAVARLEIHELPSARGCTYVVPAADFALALKVGQPFGGEMSTARKLGVTDKEIDRLSAKVIAALAKQALEPSELREAVGGAARSLGPEGKKKGLTTTLPVALDKLQSEGEIRRLPTDGRLDQQRYRYTLWRPNPLAGSRLSPEEANAQLAQRFFRWIGPASQAEFQWFSGLGVKAARAAMEPLGLVLLAGDRDRWILPEDRDSYQDFKEPPTPRYALVSSLDSISLLRRDVIGLVDPADLERTVLGEGGTRELGGLSDLPNHAILDRGRLVGLWEFDPHTASIVGWAFGAKGKALEEAVARTEEFVRADLGDARSFSLDSPKRRAPRIEALRKASARRP